MHNVLLFVAGAYMHSVGGSEKKKNVYFLLLEIKILHSISPTH